MEDPQAIDLTAKPFRVGPWTVTPDRHEWHAGGDSRRVPPRLMLLLRCLARARGDTVSREKLLDEVWERRVLNDEVLSRSIADLRQALDDDAREPRFIQTIPKLGYRLIAPVEFSSAVEAFVAPEPNELPPPADVMPDLVSEFAATEQRLAPTLPGKKHGLIVAGSLLLLLLLLWLLGSYTRTLSQQASLKPVIGAAELLLARPVASSEQIEFSPRFSADGQWLAYAINHLPEPGSHLVLRSRDGSAQRQFTPSSAANDVCPVFVGRDLIWTRHTRSGCALMKQAVLGDTPSVIGACAALRSCPDISADKTLLAFTAAPKDGLYGSGLALLDLRSGEWSSLTAPPASAGDDIDPRFSPQGELSFVRGVLGTQSLWQMPARANAPARRLDFVESMIFGQAYLPDGHLLVASDALGFRALLKFAPNLASSASNPELVGARGARYPDVASDGSVVYEIAHYDANLWRYSSDAKPIRLTRSNRYESYPILSPDAKTLLYQSNQHGLEAIYSLQLGPEHANEQKLPLDAADRWAHPAFKHRSDAVWLTRYGKTHTELWQILPGAQAPQRALGFPLGAHDASDDPHSEHVWFLLGESAPINLMRRAKSENSADELVARDVLSYRIDTRGLFLIYRSKPDQLWHCTAAPDMRPCKLLPLRIAPGHARNWALSDHAVYFVAPANADDANHWSSRYDFSSQKISTLDVPAPSTSHGLAVARDESMVVTAQLDGLAVDLNWWLAPP